MFFKLFKIKRGTTRGFSLIEVLITSAIIGILTGVVLVRYNGFNSSVLLKNQAFELALAIREAQVFSVSIRGDGSEFREAYGVHIDLTSGPTQTYTLFLDNGSDAELFDASDQIVETVLIDSRFEIHDICVTIGGSERCSSASGNSDPNSLDVSFRRPNFDARIGGVRNSGSNFTRQDSARILLRSIGIDSIERQLVINSTGQITVE